MLIKWTIKILVDFILAVYDLGESEQLTTKNCSKEIDQIYTVLLVMHC